jgi:hypothetical protein
MLHVGDQKCLTVEVVHEFGTSKEVQVCKSRMFEGSVLRAVQIQQLCVVVVTASSADTPTRQVSSYRINSEMKRSEGSTVTLFSVLILTRSSMFRIEGLLEAGRTAATNLELKNVTGHIWESLEGELSVTS